MASEEPCGFTVSEVICLERKPVIKDELIPESTVHNHLNDNTIVEDGSGRKEKKKEIFMCNFCHKTCVSLSQLKIHERTHTGEKPYECDICLKKFSTVYDVHCHRRSHTGERPFKCEQCEKCFVTSSNLAAHRKNHSDKRPFACRTCEKPFRTVSSRSTHEKTHSGDRPLHKLHQCSLCPKTFTSASNLTRHQVTHTNDKPFVCGVCDRSFGQAAHLRSHMRTHTGEKPYSCHQCPKTFRHSPSLVNHLKCHSGERPYQCSQCEKSFVNTSHLKKHEESHTIVNAKSYKCDHCELAFSTSYELSVHKRVHTGGKHLECNICHQKFLNIGGLKSHITKIHTQEENCKCDSPILKAGRSSCSTCSKNTLQFISQQDIGFEHNTDFPEFMDEDSEAVSSEENKEDAALPEFVSASPEKLVLAENCQVTLELDKPKIKEEDITDDVTDNANHADVSNPAGCSNNMAGCSTEDLDLKTVDRIFDECRIKMESGHLSTTVKVISGFVIPQ